MTIKVECGCGTRYSFEVEPQNGRMPFAVNCPNCKSEGTDAANEIIAQTAASPHSPKPRLRVQTTHSAPLTPDAPVEPEAAPAATAQLMDAFCTRHPDSAATGYCVVCKKPICAACMASFGYLCSVNCRYEAESKNMDVPVYKGQRRRMEERASRWGYRIAGAIVVLALAALGAWIWYSFVGSRPHLADSIRLAGPPAAVSIQFIGPQQLLIVNPARAALHDFSARRDLWSTSLEDSRLSLASPRGGDSASPAPLPRCFVDKDNIWICLGNSVKCLDRLSGAVKHSIAIPDQFVSFTPADSSLLVISAPDETRRLATRIDLSTGDAQSQEIVVPRSQKHILPNELPPNVQPTAGVLLSQALEDQKFNKPLDAMSSQFFSAGENLVELRVKLLEPKVTWVQTIKPRGPSLLNGATSVSTSAAGVEEEVFNDLKRDRTGGVRAVDESRYEVRLRRWTGPQPVEWQGAVLGAPSFFSLGTVDLLVAGKSLVVFDKQNRKLFESVLAYPIADRFVSNNPAWRGPGVQTADTLYFFDQGVLTAFALPGGQVRWRLTSFGIAGVQFDSQAMLYVDSTSATPEDIQYPDQVKFEHIAPVLLKVDPKSGKILWKADDVGQMCFVSGRFLYSRSVRGGGIAMANALRGALGAPEGDDPVYFRLYRLDPATGEVIWKLYREQAPEEVAFQGNRFVLRFGDDVQFFKFLALE
jgi:hypothetical protein